MTLKSIEPRQFEPKTQRTRRRVWGGVAELLAVYPATCVVGQIAELSRWGCLVRTHKALPVGTSVSLKITDRGREFTASGEVIHMLSEQGMDIEFTGLLPGDEELLDAWLTQAAA